MKILCLAKRRPQGRDLINRPFGRFCYLPRALAARGHEVRVLLASYRNEPAVGPLIDKPGVHWFSRGIRYPGRRGYLAGAALMAQEWRPDWVCGFSDTYYGILAQRIAAKIKCRSMIDAYDNYESYLPWCKPLHLVWRHALANTDLVTAAGPQLAELMGKGRTDKPTLVLPMSADPTGFSPLDKIKCREELGLPVHGELIGYCGSIHPSRGINQLFEAFKIILKKNTNAELILSGKKAPGITIPDGARWLGYLPDEQIPILLNSMNVLTVINRASRFGNYSYPIKLYEAMCCQVPVVATATLSTRWILADFPDLLAGINDNTDLSTKIITAMRHKKIDYGQSQGWEDGANILAGALLASQ